MKKKNDMIKGKARELTRRGFAAAGLAGMGMIMARAAVPGRVGAKVSIKEAAHYVPLENGEGKNETWRG